MLAGAPGHLFGLDQINMLLSMYLMVGPSGAAYSLDRRLKSRRLGAPLPPAEPSMAANIAVRLIQLHLCVIYLYAGMGKLMGPVYARTVPRQCGRRSPTWNINRSI